MHLTETLPMKADDDAVWKTISEIESMSIYWPEFKSLQILERKDSVAHALAELTLTGNSEITIFISPSQRTLVLRYESGPFTGTQRISVEHGLLQTTWDVNPTGLAPSSLWDEKRLRVGTRQALENIASVAVGQMAAAPRARKSSKRRSTKRSEFETMVIPAQPDT